MKIIGTPTSLQQTSGTGASVRPQKSAGGHVATNNLTASGNSTQAAGKTVRISRFPEEAALFAYNRHAQVNVAAPQAQIDEYV
jgi:hypothetical protein